MSARSLRNMAFGYGAVPGGSHAPTPSYAEPSPGPSLRHRPPAGTRPAPRLQAQGLDPDPLGRVAGLRRRGHLDPRRLLAARRPPLRGDDPQGPLRLAARALRTPAAAQSRLGRPLAPGVAPGAATAGDRPDLGPLSRRTLRR